MSTALSGSELILAAEAIAARAHDGQVDKVGGEYVVHLRSVASRVRPHTAEHIAVALLHDVIEDSAYTADDLRDARIPNDVVAAVALLTRTEDVAPEDYYAGIRTNDLALAVKLADLADNTDPARLHRLPERTQDRLRTKYRQAYAELGAADLADAL